MSEFVTLFQDFLYVLTASVLAFTAYNVYDRYVDRQDRKDMMRSIADTHQMTMQSMLGIHSVSKTQEAIRDSEKKEPQSNGVNTVTVVHEVTREKESEKTQTNGGK
jgi:Tfp pilus assembly protein PilE